MNTVLVPLTAITKYQDNRNSLVTVLEAENSKIKAIAYSGGQKIGVSASAPVLPMNIQGLFPLGLTGWISLPSKGLSRILSKTTVQKWYGPLWSG